MASARVRERMRSNGLLRYQVVYRMGGRGFPTLTAGTFDSRERAEARKAEILRMISSAQPPKRPAGVELIYFVRDERGEGLIKIGMSVDPVKRLREMQTGSNSRLMILATTGGGAAREVELHRRFKAARRHGEWFEATPELLAFIAALNFDQNTRTSA